MKFIKATVLTEKSILRSPDKYEYREILINLDQISHITTDKTTKGEIYYKIWNANAIFAWVDPKHAKEIFDAIGVEY